MSRIPGTLGAQWVADEIRKALTMPDEMTFYTIERHATEIASSASAAYWLATEHCNETAAHHERGIHERFKKLAETLGYNIERQHGAKNIAASAEQVPA